MRIMQQPRTMKVYPRNNNKLLSKENRKEYKHSFSREKKGTDVNQR